LCQCRGGRNVSPEVQQCSIHRWLCWLLFFYFVALSPQQRQWIRTLYPCILWQHGAYGTCGDVTNQSVFTVITGTPSSASLAIEPVVGSLVSVREPCLDSFLLDHCHIVTILSTVVYHKQQQTCRSTAGADTRAPCSPFNYPHSLPVSSCRRLDGRGRWWWGHSSICTSHGRGGC